jgi:hypothetical protein
MVRVLQYKSIKYMCWYVYKNKQKYQNSINTSGTTTTSLLEVIIFR